MKISTKRIGILFVFIAILIQSISISIYETDVLGERKKTNLELVGQSIDQEEVYLTVEEQKTLELINEYRIQNGLKELKPVSSLQYVAKIKANDLVQNEYFSHTSKILGTPFELLENNNIDYMIAGENLAGNTTPERAVKAWIESKSHKDNILEEKYQYTGISVIESPVYGRVFVQFFMGI